MQYEQTSVFSKSNHLSSMESVFVRFLSQSKSCFAFYARFHVLFISFLSLQLLSFLLFFSYFSKSVVCAFAIAIFFFTLFSYFVLLFFFQAKKPDQILHIRANFLQSVLPLLRGRNPDSPSHLEVSQTASKAASLIIREECRFYKSEFFFSALSPLIGKCKIRLYWKSFHMMKEALFFMGVEQITARIKEKPTDPEAHALLAQMYSDWSLIYLPSKESLPWIPAEYFSEPMEEKFKACSSRAVEEYSILLELGEKNHWILSKLGKIYELQGKPEEEMKQYEQILSLNPEDEEALLRLGVLYFDQGYNLKGLKLYERFKELFPEKAEKLIESYPFSPFPDFLTLKLS